MKTPAKTAVTLLVATLALVFAGSSLRLWDRSNDTAGRGPGGGCGADLTVRGSPHELTRLAQVRRHPIKPTVGVLDLLALPQLPAAVELSAGMVVEMDEWAQKLVLVLDDYQR